MSRETTSSMAGWPFSSLMGETMVSHHLVVCLKVMPKATNRELAPRPALSTAARASTALSSPHHCVQSLPRTCSKSSTSTRRHPWAVICINRPRRSSTLVQSGLLAMICRLSSSLIRASASSVRIGVMSCMKPSWLVMVPLASRKAALRTSTWTTSLPGRTRRNSTLRVSPVAIPRTQCCCTRSRSSGCTRLSQPKLGKSCLFSPKMACSCSSTCVSTPAWSVRKTPMGNTLARAENSASYSSWAVWGEWSAAVSSADSSASGRLAWNLRSPVSCGMSWPLNRCA
ncbi:hypothetical protein FQZ97_881520 [compost metagenome]